MSWLSLIIHNARPAITKPKNPIPIAPTRRSLAPLSEEVEVTDAEDAVFDAELPPEEYMNQSKP